jgi:solute carrier family 6 amino acid transporter-like protein 5/7/9/14
MWAILFFLMIFALGIDTMIATTEIITSSIIDEHPWLRSKKHWVAMGTCLAGFICGLPLCCQVSLS